MQLQKVFQLFELVFGENYKHLFIMHIFFYNYLARSDYYFHCARFHTEKFYSQVSRRFHLFVTRKTCLHNSLFDEVCAVEMTPFTTVACCISWLRGASPPELGNLGWAELALRPSSCTAHLGIHEDNEDFSMLDIL